MKSHSRRIRRQAQRLVCRAPGRVSGVEPCPPPRLSIAQNPGARTSVRANPFGIVYSLAIFGQPGGLPESSRGSHPAACPERARGARREETPGYSLAADKPSRELNLFLG